MRGQQRGGAWGSTPGACPAGWPPGGIVGAVMGNHVFLLALCLGCSMYCWSNQGDIQRGGCCHDSAIRRECSD
jgi:hypothetical protein